MMVIKILKFNNKSKEDDSEKASKSTKAKSSKGKDLGDIRLKLKYNVSYLMKNKTNFV